MKDHRHNLGYEFVQPPVDFTKETEKELLQYCLGGVLYMPATKKIIEKVLVRNPPAPSMVMCFEDAIREEDLSAAEANVLDHLTRLSKALKTGMLSRNDLPLIFLRVRNPKQFPSFAARLTAEQASGLPGFNSPNFYSSNEEGDLVVWRLSMNEWASCCTLCRSSKALQ